MKNELKSKAFLKAKFMLKNANFLQLGAALNYARLFIGDKKQMECEKDEIKKLIWERTKYMIP